MVRRPVRRHSIGLTDVEEVVLYPPQYVKPGRGGTTLIYGTTREGRMLLVVVTADPEGNASVVTAREMDGPERRTFAGRNENDDAFSGAPAAAGRLLRRA